MPPRKVECSPQGVYGSVANAPFGPQEEPNVWTYLTPNRLRLAIYFVSAYAALC